MYEELKYWYLRDHKLFTALSTSQIKQLCIIVGFKKAKKGDIIYLSSEVPRIFLLKKGNIKIVSIDQAGNETIKEILRKGDLFGELSLEHDAGANEYAKALTDEVSICSFLMSDFEDLLVRNPALALSYTKFVGLKMKRIRNNYANLVSKDARTRLISFLREWAEREGQHDGNQVTIDNYLTQADMAQIVCTSRQTVALLLNELQEKNLIYYDRKLIMIDDVSKL